MHSLLARHRLVPLLRARGGRLAVVAPDGEPIGYRDLAARVAETAERLGGDRRLVLLEAADDVDSLVTYLAALHGGHPVLVAAPGAGFDALLHRYDPDVVARHRAGRPEFDERRPRSAHALHPELALLLSTSGSTGSPKLVRLSATNIAANAAAIAGYLDIRDTDRAALSLPMHYCYGLSIVHSNLLRGAALLMSDRSVTDPRFFEAFREHRGTSLHGVPHTFDLLDRVGFPDMALPHLRYVTQAGGRLPAAAVRRYARLGEQRGWRFHVMYGATEATARMAHLPPELAAANPAAIGVPVPGGSFEIDAADGRGVGELVYRGPNVMLGYARTPADLARGRTVDALRTGDLARRHPDGLYEVVGRRSRMAKLFGLRIDLEQVERLLADDGITAAVAGSDDGLTVTVTGGADPEHVARHVAQRVGLPRHAVTARGLDALPRTPSGKIDHAALAAAAAAEGRRARWRSARPRSVREAFRVVFPLQDLPDDATFVDLGGDSLSYVRMSTELSRVLGHLPTDWDITPIGRLERLPRRGPGPWAALETGVALRALAIVLVVGTHVQLFDVTGGAHLLLVLSGWAFARFVLAPRAGPDAHADLPGSTGPSAAILRCLLRIAVPTAAWIAWRASTEPDVGLVNALLLNQFLDPSTMGYWYIEAVVHILLLLAVVLASPAARRWERAQPFGFAAVLLVVALAARALPDPGSDFSDRLMSTHLVLWMFVLGWLVHRADTPARRLVAGASVLLLVPEFFPWPPQAAVVTVGILMLLLVPRIAVPRALARPVGAIAEASLAVYLTHYALYPALLAHLSPLPVVLACLGLGIAAWWACRVAVRGLTELPGALDELWRRAGPAAPATGDAAGPRPLVGATRPVRDDRLHECRRVPDTVDG